MNNGNGEQPTKPGEAVVRITYDAFTGAINIQTTPIDEITLRGLVAMALEKAVLAIRAANAQRAIVPATQLPPAMRGN